MERFRAATEQDVDAILGMMQGFYAEDGYPFDAAESRRAVLGLIGSEQLGGLWVAVDDAGVCGYLAVTLGYSLEWRGRDAFLDELFLAERARARGLGSEALRVAEAFCRRSGVRALHLEVEPHREGAFELYRRSGFVDHARRLMTLRLG
jgi:ribosomal protein S18 acetylase RimI-like enzyme